MSDAINVELAILEMVTGEIEKETGGLLPKDMRQRLAARVIKVIDDYNRTVAIAAMEKAKQTMVVAAVASAAKEPNGIKK